MMNDSEGKKSPVRAQAVMVSPGTSKDDSESKKSPGRAGTFKVSPGPSKKTSGNKGKKAACASSKKTKVKPNHPPTSEMVMEAISQLKDRKGSSLYAIKKYIGSKYTANPDTLAPFIRRFLKSAVAGGLLTQPKGKGAAGSFKIVKGAPGGTKTASTKAKKPTKPKEAPQKKTASKKPEMKQTKKPTPRKSILPSERPKRQLLQKRDPLRKK